MSDGAAKPWPAGKSAGYVAGDRVASIEYPESKYIVSHVSETHDYAEAVNVLGGQAHRFKASDLVKLDEPFDIVWEIVRWTSAEKVVGHRGSHAEARAAADEFEKEDRSAQFIVRSKAITRDELVEILSKFGCIR